MSFPSEYQALISLVEDPDPQVRQQIILRIKELGQDILPVLRATLEQPEDNNSQEVIRTLHQLVEDIQFNEHADRVVEWFHDSEDLLKGFWLLSQTSGTDIDIHDINKEIERIKLEVWLDLRYELTALEKINVLNHVFFKRFGFKASESNFHHSDNSFLHKVLRKKEGNPISLALLYSIVAQRLYIPVFGVNLPQHFVLAYLDIPDWPSPTADSRGFNRQPPSEKNVLFYINTFNEGAVFGKKHIDDFLQKIQAEPKPTHYYPCSHQDSIRRVVRNLINAFAVSSNHEMLHKYEHLLGKLPPASL
jgi:regulator of sirC expression with transglutaminase-like and TPR domain